MKRGFFIKSPFFIPMENNTSQNLDIEKTRETLLASLYTHDSKLFDKTFSNLINSLKLDSSLLENDEKSLYQIALAVKKLKGQQTSQPLARLLKARTRLQTKNPVTIDYDTWKTNLGIDGNTLKILFATTSNVQLSTGCSNNCKRCNEWALPGVRKQFSYNAITEIAKQLKKENNLEYALYSASDPLDWQDNNKNITHLMAMLSKNNLTPAFGLLTKIPSSKKKIFQQLVQAGTDISASITLVNRKRVEYIEEQLSTRIDKQHDSDDLLIPAGRDEDFCTVKSSITDSYGTEITPCGAFIVLPAFTSALNPTGQKRIPINKDTQFFIKKMVGHKGLKFDYFAHLKVISRQNSEYTLDFLLDSQIENLALDSGDYDVTQPGMISLKEYFETFKPKAVNKRKSMFTSVKKRLKAEYPHGEFNVKLKEYKELCNQDSMNRLKQKTIVHFLSSIKKYLIKNSSKKVIIAHLRKKEMALIKSDKTNQIIKALGQPESDTFLLFTQLVLLLLENPDNTLVADFL